MPPNRKRRAAAWGMIILTLILLLAAAAITTVVILKNQTTIPTLIVTRGDVVKAFYATGTVRPDRAYTIKSKAQGALVQMPVREGQLVKKGDILAQVDDQQLQFEVARQQSEVKMAQAQAAEGLSASDDLPESPQHQEIAARLAEARQQLQIADSTLKRKQDMLDKGAGTQQEMDDARKDHVQ